MPSKKELDLLGTFPQESQVDLCVVYDETTGEIIHSHQIVTLEGATPPTPEELEAEALSLAGADTTKPKIRMAVLPVQSENFRPDATHIYKVDLKTKCLVRIPAKATKPEGE